MSARKLIAVVNLYRFNGGGTRGLSLVAKGGGISV